jgi:hypothetical protein
MAGGEAFNIDRRVADILYQVTAANFVISIQFQLKLI